MPRVLHGFKKQGENLSKYIKWEGPLMLQMPWPADEPLNHSLNLANRVMNNVLCKSSSETLVTLRDPTFV